MNHGQAPQPPAGFAAAVTDRHSTIEITLRGNADLTAIESMGAALTKAHTSAVSARAREVVVDFRQVDFMNSSCLKTFVRWLSQIQALPPARQYRVRFVPNSGKYWQRASLVALAGFAVDLVHVDGEPG